MVKSQMKFKILLVITLLCFLLPFFTVSCQNEKIRSFSGLETVVGAKMETPLTGDSTYQKPDIFGIIAFVSVVAAIGISFVAKNSKPVAPAVLALVTAASLLVLNSRVNALAEGQYLSIKIEYGYFLAMLCSLAAGGYGLYLTFANKGISGIRTAKAGLKTCAKCGTSTELAISYCVGCNEKL